MCFFTILCVSVCEASKWEEEQLSLRKYCLADCSSMQGEIAKMIQAYEHAVANAVGKLRENIPLSSYKIRMKNQSKSTLK